MRNVLLTFALLLTFGLSFGQIKVVTSGYTGIGEANPVEQLHVGGNMAMLNPLNDGSGPSKSNAVYGVGGSKRMLMSTDATTSASNAYFQMFGQETQVGGVPARAGEFVMGGAYIAMRTGATVNGANPFGTINWELDAAGNVTNFGGNTSASFRMIADGDKMQKSSGFNYGLDEILQMEPKKLTSTLAKSNEVESVGVLAEEMSKIAPELVSTIEYNDLENDINEKYQAIDMSAITFMLVNSIKEQQALIDAQNERIAEMEATILNMANGTTTQTVEIRDSRLGQNAPNPFTQATVINYTVPTKAQTAVMQVFDMNGNLLKSVNVANGNGQLTINAGELAAGTYSYNLVVDGTIVDAKKMILTK